MFYVKKIISVSLSAADTLHLRIGLRNAVAYLHYGKVEMQKSVYLGVANIGHGESLLDAGAIALVAPPHHHHRHLWYHGQEM